MPVREAVLGLVTERRSYGYQLAQQFQQRVGPAWQLSDNAVYPALDSLAKEGLVQRARDPDGGLVTKQAGPRSVGRALYEVTDAGREWFERWMRDSANLSPFREELH